MNPSKYTIAGLAAGALLALSVPGIAAPLRLWTGGGGSPNWSDGANWAPGGAPVDGDAVSFSGSPTSLLSLVDLSVRLDSLSFAALAGPFQLHVAGDGARVLSFGGAGIRNLTSGAGPIRQSLYADAGTTGGSILFAGTSGINLGVDNGFRPVDLTALGGSVAGQTGGRLVFQDQSSTGLSTFNNLRAEGASVPGAGAGQIFFRDNAVATAFTTLTLVGGRGNNAAGGQASFADGVQVDAIVNVLGGQSGGAGGRAVFANAAVAGVRSTINNQGGTGAAGSEALTEFRDASRLSGTVVNAAATAGGANGGRIEFRDRASFDSTGYDGSLGSLQIINQAGSLAGAGGGSTVFRDDSAARGSFLVIVNGGDAEGSGAGTLGGTTRFADRSRAGELTIYNEAGRGATGAGSTSFENSASADRSQVENKGGRRAGDAGGSTLFRDFASAGSATLVNAAGDVSGAGGGATRFIGSSGAGTAFIRNEASTSAGGGGRGTTTFADASSAQHARIDNQGGVAAINAFTTFSQGASAGDAVITNFGGPAAGGGGGFTQFIDNASAGNAMLVMAAGVTNGASGGRVDFFSSSTAGAATLDVRGGAVNGASGGQVSFSNTASAGTAQFIVQGSQTNNPTGREGAIVTFSGSSTAASATFLIQGNTSAFGDVGRVQFGESTTAASASFSTLAGFDAGGRLSFEGAGSAIASAGHARITNGSRTTASGSTGDFGGATLFLANSSADHASITNEAGRTAFGAQTVFGANSTAADAVIVNAGGRAGDTGGITFFQGSSNAGRAVISNAAGPGHAAGITRFDDNASAAQSSITAQGAVVAGESGGLVSFTGLSSAGSATLMAEGGRNGGAGGRIAFDSQANGGSARIVLGGTGDSGGTLDISRTDVWVAVGSIAGSGTINLGARTLIVGNRDETTFSGVIHGETPPVFPSLAVQGRLTLTGANDYSGRTVIGDGVNPNSGKLVVANTEGSATGTGQVLVQRGGTLSGSGFVAGPVTLQAGGTIAPGDPVTLTLRDSLTWDGGGVIRLVLGADTAGSDQVHVGSLIRGSDGLFVFDFIDAGIVAGMAYDLLSFDSMLGFAATDFEAHGYDGMFSLDHGVLGFTAASVAAPVPEPATWLMLLLGLAGTWCMRRRASLRHSMVSSMCVAMMLVPGLSHAQAPGANATEAARQAALIDRGRYMVVTGHCNNCHTNGYAAAAGAVPETQWLMGNPVGWRGKEGTVYAPNLRIYMQAMDVKTWLLAARNGRPRAPMPWWSVRDTSDDDLVAMYLYIRSLQPVGLPAPSFLAPDQVPKPPYNQLPDMVLP